MAITKLSEFEMLKQRIKSREVVIGVIGLGYVGLPLAYGLEVGGASVIGFDVDPRKIEHLAAGTAYMEHLPNETFSGLANSDRFEATADMRRLSDCDVVIVCVPTPLGQHHCLLYTSDAADE